jgi:hypothetical protein
MNNKRETLMKDDDPDLQDQEWNILFDRVSETLHRLSETIGFGDEDYWILNDNWGHQRQEIEIRNLRLLQPFVVEALQALLADYPKWEIAIGIDVVEKFKGWPGMGIIVRSDEIVDGLQRECLPQELQAIAYQGRVRKLGTANQR